MLFKTLCIYLEVIIMDNVLLLSIQPQNLQNIDKTMNCELFWMKFKIKSWFLGPMRNIRACSPLMLIYDEMEYSAGHAFFFLFLNGRVGYSFYGIQPWFWPRLVRNTFPGGDTSWWMEGGLYISIAHGSLLCHVIPTHWDILRDISNIHFKCE